MLTRVGPHALVAHRSQADAQFVFDGVFGADQGSPSRLLSILQPTDLRACGSVFLWRSEVRPSILAEAQGLSGLCCVVQVRRW